MKLGSELYPHISGAGRYVRQLCHKRSLPSSLPCCLCIRRKTWVVRTSSEQRSNNQVVVYRAGSLRRRLRAVAVGCLGRRGLYDTMRSAIYAAELLGSPVTMRCAWTATKILCLQSLSPLSSPRQGQWVVYGFHHNVIAWFKVSWLHLLILGWCPIRWSSDDSFGTASVLPGSSDRHKTHLLCRANR